MIFNGIQFLNSISNSIKFNEIQLFNSMFKFKWKFNEIQTKIQLASEFRWINEIQLNSIACAGSWWVGGEKPWVEVS